MANSIIKLIRNAWANNSTLTLSAMSNPNADYGSKLFRRYVAAAALVWTAIIVASLLSNIHLTSEQAMELVRREAIANFNKDQGFRL